MRKTLIVGATSAIAEATARLLAPTSAALFLVARNEAKLQAVAQDLRVRSGGRCAVFGHVMDANDVDGVGSMLVAAEKAMGGVDLALIAHGTLPDQRACERSVELTLNEIRTNALSVVALATHLANRFAEQGYGTLAVIGSVAGDRGRQSNYVYGAAKGMVDVFLQGLRNRLAGVGVHVLTIKPGFVDTPMTAAFPKGPLWARPEVVAAGIVRAIERQRDVVYLPWFWRWIMLAIRMIPERVFKRMKL